MRARSHEELQHLQDPAFGLNGALQRVPDHGSNPCRSAGICWAPIKVVHIFVAGLVESESPNGCANTCEASS